MITYYARVPMFLEDLISLPENCKQNSGWLASDRHIDAPGLESRDRRNDGQHSWLDGASLLLLN